MANGRIARSAGAILLLGASIAVARADAQEDRRGPPGPRAPVPAVASTGRAVGTGAGAGTGRVSPLAPRARRAPASLRSLDPLRHRAEDGTLVADLEGGDTALLSLDPALQTAMSSLLARYEVPWGAVVAIEPSTGRVLSYVSHSSADPEAGDLARAATAPAASVFKVITGAALLDAGVATAERVCYHGGGSRLTMAQLTDDPRLDTQCATLEDAMGGSINAVFAKLADRHLDPDSLGRYASAFGFGETLPFDLPVSSGAVELPEDRLEFARTSAGFWHSRLSPLHGALIAATIANEGRMPRASMVDQVIDRDGHVVWDHVPRVHREVIGRRTARALDRMMRRTVSRGTARRAFHDERGVPFLPGIEVAGKTGTLSSERPFRGYTWWIGFAPADAPTIAVAALVINRPEWRIKASFVAREALREYLIVRPREQARARARAEAQRER
jgi:peptidoglycan glycosyltransferase